MLVTGAAFAQTAPKLTFEVASVKPAAPLDMAKMQAAMAAGEAPKIGMRVDAARVEFTYLDLKTLVSIAYKLKPYQVTGPDWMASERYDIIAKIPDGATKDDIPQMLQALLKERLKLDAHLESKEHPVLGLVIGKGGPKLKESEGGAPTPIDESAPMKEGEMKMDTPDGPVRMKVDPKTGGGTVNMGAKGSMAFHMSGAPTGGAPTAADLSAMTLHMDGKQMTMSGFVEMLGQFSSQLAGGSGRQIVDMTGLKGHYDVSLDISFADLIAMARAQGYDVPGMPGGGGSAQAASDPSGTAGLFGSVQALGLKLEPRKAVVDQIVVDHAEKVPTAN